MAAKYKLLKTLSAMEVEEKIEMGICFVCDKPLTLDHAMTHKRIRFVVKEMDEEDDLSQKFQPQASSDDTMEYSTHNLQINFQEASVTHEDDSSKALVNATKDNLSNFQQFDDDNLANPDIIDELTEIAPPTETKPTRSSISDPCFEILSCAKFSTCRLNAALSVTTHQVFDTIPMKHLRTTSTPLNQQPTTTTSVRFTEQRVKGISLFPKFIRFQYFDPGGVVSPLFPSRVSLSSAPTSSLFQSQIAIKLFDDIPKCHVAVNSYVLQTACQLFDVMPKYHIAVWNVINSRYLNNEMENVTFDLSKSLNLICIAPGHYTIFNILLLCSLKFFIYGSHISNVVIKNRLLVWTYVVYPLATKCFNHRCVLVAYEEFEEVEYVVHIYVPPNYMMVIINWLTNALVVFRERYWASFFPIEASHDNIALLEIHNSFDNETEKSQLLVNYDDAIIKLLIAIGDIHKPFADLLCSSWLLQGYLQELTDISERNGSVDSLNGFKIILQQDKEMAPKLHHVHSWSSFNDIFHDECSYFLEYSHNYFHDSAEFYFVTKASVNAIFLLCLYIMQSHLRHPKLVLELLKEVAHVHQQQWFIPLSGPRWIGKKLKSHHFMSAYHFAMAEFDLKQDQSVLCSIGPKSFVKFNKWPVERCYGFKMVSYVIRNSRFECFGMSIDDVFSTMWRLLSVQVTAEIKAFVRAHVVCIDHSIGELLYEHLIALRSEAKEDGSGIGPEFPLLQKGLNGVGKWKMIDRGSVVDTKRKLKWRDLPHKHGTREFYIAVVDVCVVINAAIIVWELWLSHQTLVHLYSAAGSHAAIQMFLNYISKIQGLLCLVPNDWNPCFITKVWNERFQLQGASMIKPIASPLHSESYKLFKVPLLKPFQRPHSNVACLSQYSFGPIFKQVETTTIFHRKMINWGSVLDLKVLIK